MQTRRVMTISILCLGWTVSSFGTPSFPADNSWVPHLVSSEEMADGFYPLFNGKNLDGWWIRGKNKRAYKIKEEKVITTGEGGGNWLFSSKMYENFVLRYEYHALIGDNFPGISVRVPSGGNPDLDGIRIHKGSLLQNPLTTNKTPPELIGNPPGTWHVVEVLCNGSHIRTMIDGYVWYDTGADLGVSSETSTPSPNQCALMGHIALQDGGEHVVFRKIRLKPLPGGQGWSLLFNGKNFEGWRVSDDGTYEICEGGVLRLKGQMRGNSNVQSRREFCTLETFGDAAIRMSIRPHANARSGLCIYRPGVMSWQDRFVLPIDNHNSKYGTGSIYRRMAALELRTMDDAWMQMEVIMRGVNIQVSINGKTVADYVARRALRRTPGRIGLQIPEGDGIVDFKDIEVKPLQ